MFALLLASAADALPQTSSSSLPQSTFTSNSELVMVPVQVMLGGQPVHGLTKDDFTLESDGNVQHIRVFDEFRRSTQVFLPEPRARGPATRFVNFSNLPADGMPHELVVLAIDKINTIGFLQEWTKDQILKYLQAHPPQQPTALVEITPDGLLEFHAPTTDAAELISALQKMQIRTGAFTPELTGGLHASFHGGPGEYAMAMANIDQARSNELRDSLRAIRLSLRGFEQLAQAYSAVPGRKTVLWFTSGFPALDLEPDEPPLFSHPGPPHAEAATSLRHMGKHLLPEFQQAFIAMDRSHVVLYPVDVAAFSEDRLWGSWGGDLCSDQLPASVPYSTNWMMGTSCGSWLDRIGLKIVARSTGGVPCDAGHHVDHCIDAAEGESNGYYLLGFYVSQESRNIGWHDLKVHVKGEHDAVRARSGYFLEAPGPLPKWQEKRALDDAIVAAVEYTGIPFTVEPGKREAGGATPFKVSVPASSIAMLPGQDKLSFDVVSIPISNHGVPIEGTGRITNVDIKEDGTQKALAHGWQLVDMVSVPPGTAAVKVVIRDNLTGRIGSVVFPVDKEFAGGNWPAPKNGAILLLNGSKSD